MSKILKIVAGCWLLVIGFGLLSFSQETPEEQTIEDISEGAEDEIDYTTLFDELSYYAEHPLNLNFATKEQLEDLVFLNDVQIENLLKYREKQGNLATIYELQNINGFDEKIIEQISPYITIEPLMPPKRDLTLKSIANYGRHQLFIRGQRILEEQEGYKPIDNSLLAQNPNLRYLGSPLKIYTRYRFTYHKNISFGITGEKDAGEEFFKGSQKNGFDYYSAHLYFKDIVYFKDVAKIKSLAIGDYNAQFGQGLTLWSGLTFNKTYNTLNIKKYASGIKPYTSVNENDFMRGIGTTVAIQPPLGGNIEISGFFSKNKKDAYITVFDTLNEDVEIISSFQETGYHTTPEELEEKDAITETVYGGNINYRYQRFKAGLTAYQVLYDAMLEKSRQEPYNQYDFQGDNNSVFGFDYNYVHKIFSIFGEISLSENGGFAYLNGITSPITQNFSLAILHRHFDKDYQNLLSNAFAESSSIKNEQGLYIGISTNPIRYWSIFAYIDAYRFPWLKYQTYAPSFGSDYLVQINYSPTRNFKMYLRTSGKNGFTNSADEDEMYYLNPTLKQSYRCHIVYSLSKYWKFANRVELLTYKEGTHPTYNGYLIYQDITFKPQRVPLSVSLRYALFDTDNYDTRIYAYENDVLYAYSIPAYYYKGTRFYLLLKYRITKGIDVWLRFSQTYYSNQDTIGSDLYEIQGNTKSEIKAQVRLKF